MDSNILLAKIVASPTEATWSQAYSTLNLYIVLSIQGAGEDSIAVAGKDLLERLQREYFSQDEKTLENIKKSVEAAVAEADLDSMSIGLASLSGEVLYIVTVSAATVVLRRNGKVGIIAKGTEGAIEAFSGKIEPDDVVIVETSDFASKIPVGKLTEAVDSLGVTEISENLTPLIFEEAKGTEAAIILQYKKLKPETLESDNLAIPETEEDEKKSRGAGSRFAGEEAASETVDEEVAPTPKISLPKIGLPSLKFGKKKLILIAIAVLIVLLLGSIFVEQKNKELAAQNQVLTEILEPQEKKYEEAVALMSLNKGLALEEFIEIKSQIEASQNKLPEGSDARKKLSEFLGKVEIKIGEIGYEIASYQQNNLLIRVKIFKGYVIWIKNKIREYARMMLIVRNRYHRISFLIFLEGFLGLIFQNKLTF